MSNFITYCLLPALLCCQLVFAEPVVTDTAGAAFETAIEPKPVDAAAAAANANNTALSESGSENDTVTAQAQADTNTSDTDTMEEAAAEEEVITKPEQEIGNTVEPADYAAINTESIDEAAAIPEPGDGSVTASNQEEDTEMEQVPADSAESETHPVDTECRRIGAKLGSVGYKECMARHLTASGGKSVLGASILYKEYPPLLDKRQPLGRVLLIGGIHGDEYSSVSVVFKWMKTLDRYHSGLFHWHIVPLLNPDGLLRKHSQRMNEHNVDLNRNFPMHDWESTTQDYWVNTTLRNPRLYPGRSALSEPESRWLVQEINNFQPDVIVSVHAPYGVVDYDGPKDGPHKLGKLYLQLIGTYPGSLGNYLGVQRKIPVVTIELPYAGIMPTPAEVSGIWTDLVRWLAKNINLKASTIAQEPDVQNTDLLSN